MAMNFYTCSKEQLAELEKVGAATVEKLVELRDEAIAGLREPLTVQDLSNVRLKVEYWQGLIDKNILELTPPPNLLQPCVKGAAEQKEQPTLSEAERLEKIMEKSFKICFNRFDKKLLDNSEMLQSQINNLELGINKTLNPIRVQIEDLAQAQLHEKTRRLTFESEIDQKLQDISIREEQKSNQKINTLAQQLSTTLDKINWAQDRILAIENIYNVQSFQEEMPHSADSHFLSGPDTQTTDQKPKGFQKPDDESNRQHYGADKESLAERQHLFKGFGWYATHRDTVG